MLLLNKRQIIKLWACQSIVLHICPSKPNNREYFIITYETDPATLEKVVPYPLKVTEPIVKYEFIRMPDSSGLGDYTESGQVIPVEFNGTRGLFVLSMYLDNEPAILAGREIWSSFTGS